MRFLVAGAKKLNSNEIRINVFTLCAKFFAFLAKGIVIN